MTTPRLFPPFWRHDAYTLNHLASTISQIAKAWSQDWSVAEGNRPVVVDLGAGDAPYRPLLEAAGATYICCDLDPQAQVVIVPGQPVPLASASARAVVSFQVLEHVWDLDWYLGEAHRIMADDAALLLSTHGTWPYHPHPTDFRRWTREGLVAELSSRGFEITQIMGLVGPLAWTTQFRALGFHRLLSSLPIVGAAASAFVCTIFHLRMKLEDWLTPAAWVQSNAAVYVVVARKALRPQEATP